MCAKSSEIYSYIPFNAHFVSLVYEGRDQPGVLLHIKLVSWLHNIKMVKKKSPNNLDLNADCQSAKLRFISNGFVVNQYTANKWLFYVLFLRWDRVIQRKQSMAYILGKWFSNINAIWYSSRYNAFSESMKTETSAAVWLYFKTHTSAVVKYQHFSYKNVVASVLQVI